MKLHWYLCKRLYAVFFLVFFLFLGLQFFFTFLEEWKYIGQHRYTVFNGVVHALWVLPKRIYQLFPELLLLTCVLGLGDMYQSGELLVYRAVGCSPWWLWRAVLIIFAPIVLLLCAFTEYALPHLEYGAARYQAVHTSESPAWDTHAGIWVREGADFLYFGQLDRQGRIQGFYRFSFATEQQLRHIVYAPVAQLRKGHFSLENAVKLQAVGEGDALKWVQETLTEHGETRPNTHLPRSILSLLTTSPEWLTWQELRQYSRYLEANHQDAARYRFFLWRKALYPILLCLLPLLALSTVMGPLKRSHTGGRLVVGIFMGFVLHVVVEFGGSVALLWHANPLWIWLPLLLAATGVWAVQLRRV